MKDFIFAALPWVLIGVMLAVGLAGHERIKNDKNVGRRMAGGMCIGAALGLAFAKLLGLASSFGLSVGILTGLTAGMLIKGRKSCKE